MQKTTFSYEFMLVLSVKLSEEKNAELVKKFKDLIENEGELLSIDNWGKRKLAYPINKETEGEYILFNFKSGTEFPKELDRISKITDGILRSMIVKKEPENQKPKRVPKKETNEKTNETSEEEI